MNISTVTRADAAQTACRWQVLDWNRLAAPAQVAALARPSQQRSTDRSQTVAAILASVRADGDAALRAWTAKLDGCALDTFAVTAEEFARASGSLPAALKTAIIEAKGRIERFHRASMQGTVRVETAPGVICESVKRPITRVGLYVPAGSAPLPSTALMLGVPAQLAGCQDVLLCSPANASGEVDAAVLYVAQLCGIQRVFKLGGAQAIAAMAYGTESVGMCDKLFGPGNAWVTEAKLQVAAEGAAAIDMPAGPSEVLVIADSHADPRFVAADLLSQAEHGPDSQVLLITESAALIAAVEIELTRQLAALPRAAIATQALQSSRAIKVDAIAQAIAVSNRYAPEHLILNVLDARSWLPEIESAGSVFLGAWSPESVGDYCSGTNHVLPTYGHARAWSGLSVASFQKRISVQECSERGLAAIGPCAITLAEAEGLQAHARAVSIRLDSAGAQA
ncbi:MAG: histidinol dehydrogenase [Dokdonella sp.]